jgi:hypothetical protein
LEVVSFNTRLPIWFQHNNAPAHYSREVRQWLSEKYTGRGREAPVSWPARSPDLNPFYSFFLWEYFKTKIYASNIDTKQELWRRVQQFASKIINTLGIFEHLGVPFSRKAELCAREHGAKFEPLL